MFPRALFFVLFFAASAHADYETVDPDTSPFRLANVTAGGVPDKAWNHTNVAWGTTFVCDFASWDGLYLVEAQFCHTSDEEGAWKATNSPADFFSLYNRLDDVTEHVVSPSLSTAVGSATMVRFNLEPDVERGYQCVGLIKQYDRNRQNLFHKKLDLYVCNDGPWALSDDHLSRVLGWLSLEGEFAGLVP